jgi:hypothetical protein
MSVKMNSPNSFFSYRQRPELPNVITDRATSDQFLNAFNNLQAENVGKINCNLCSQLVVLY